MCVFSSFPPQSQMFLWVWGSMWYLSVTSQSSCISLATDSLWAPALSISSWNVTLRHRAVSSRGLQLIWTHSHTGSPLGLYRGSRPCPGFAQWCFYSWPHCPCVHCPLTPSDLWLTPSLPFSQLGARGHTCRLAFWKALPQGAGWGAGFIPNSVLFLPNFPTHKVQFICLFKKILILSSGSNFNLRYSLLTHISQGTGWNKCLLNGQTNE